MLEIFRNSAHLKLPNPCTILSNGSFAPGLEKPGLKPSLACEWVINGEGPDLAALRFQNALVVHRFVAKALVE
jgi:hypothetical protein